MKTPHRTLFSWFSKKPGKSSPYSYQILGSDSQLLEFNLLPYQTIRIEPSSLTYLDPGITLDTKITTSSSGLQRLLSGSSLFIIDLTNENEKNPAKLALTPNHYSQILHFDIEDLKSFYFVADSFLCSGPEVVIKSKFFGFKLALFNKKLFMQKFTGKGSVFVKGGINCKEIVLNDEECVVVASNALLGFSESVQVSLWVNKHPQLMTTKTNFFMLSLKGPGKVMVQNTDKEAFELSLADAVTGAGLSVSQILDYGVFTPKAPTGTRIMTEESAENEEIDHKVESNEDLNDSHNTDNTIDDTIDCNFYLAGPNN